MPGQGSYGEAGKWIHDRAHRIMESDSETPKHIAYAISTQQAHKVGKSPKDFRTPQGVHEARQKYDRPRDEYQKTAGMQRMKRIVKAMLKCMEQTGQSSVNPTDPKLKALRAANDWAAMKWLRRQEKLKTAMVAGLLDELQKIGMGIPTTPGMPTSSGMSSPGASTMNSIPDTISSAQSVTPPSNPAANTQIPSTPAAPTNAAPPNMTSR